MATPIRLLVQLFKDFDFKGQYRFLYKDVRDFGTEGFHDVVSSIKVLKGPAYSEGDRVRFYEHSNFTGGYIDLGPGLYRDIHSLPFNFGDKMSSADFYSMSEIPVPSASPIKLIVTLFENPNLTGQSRTVIRTELDLNNIGFNDMVSSIMVEAGPAYKDEVAVFCENANGSGGILQGGPFGPGTMVKDLTKKPYEFNDRISSILILPRTMATLFMQKGVSALGNLILQEEPVELN